MLAKPQKNYRKRSLPKGVYALGSKTRPFRSSFWDGITRKTNQVGNFPTVREAAYRRQVAEHGHHWDNMDVEEARDKFGFIYLMTHKDTKRMYLGKKQFYHWDGPVGGFKATDPTDEWWDAKAWKGGEWETYTSSSIEVARLAEEEPWNFTYEVVDYGADKLDLHICEVNQQIAADVLEALDVDGEFLFYNKNIAGMLFRPPFKKAELKEVKEATVEDMRNYYLKPMMCLSCKSVIPYGMGGVKCSCGFNPGDPFGK